jgi:hypothetical protein
MGAAVVVVGAAITEIVAVVEAAFPYASAAVTVRRWVPISVIVGVHAKVPVTLTAFEVTVLVPLNKSVTLNEGLVSVGAFIWNVTCDPTPIVELGFNDWIETAGLITVSVSFA